MKIGRSGENRTPIQGFGGPVASYAPTYILMKELPIPSEGRDFSVLLARFRLIFAIYHSAPMCPDQHPVKGGLELHEPFGSLTLHG